MTKHYSDEELTDIYLKFIPEGLWVPLWPQGRTAKTGPAVRVFLRYSDVVPEANGLEERYWEALQRTPVIPANGILSIVNGILSSEGGADPETHRLFNGRLLPSDLLRRVTDYQPGGPASPVVFNRIGCLQLIRHLMMYGNQAISDAEQPMEALGELALLGNEFIQPDPPQMTGEPTNLDLLLQTMSDWDIYNPSDLAYALTRTFIFLTKILPGQDAVVRKLSLSSGIDPSQIMVGDLALGDYIATVFGLYAYGRKMVIADPRSAIVNRPKVFEKVGFPLPLLSRFLDSRSLTISQFVDGLGGNVSTRESFAAEVRRRSFLTDSLNLFRQYPFLRLDEDQALILDLQFMVELLTLGVYWKIYDSLPTSKREPFRELWGRIFELYTVGLLREFYPPASGMMVPDARFPNGQIDALLDFGPEVFVFEMKASLLTEPAKRLRDRAEFVKDLNLKFVRNEQGKPKAVIQLVTSCKAIERGAIRTAARAVRIYPVLVGDERIMEAFCFNAYLNEIFQNELGPSPVVQPTTSMSVKELEEALTCISQGVFGWAELFGSRFNDGEVGPFSVHQAIYDLMQKKNVQIQRSQVIRKTFDEVYSIISSKYNPQK
jgi:hypothetical protein